MSTAPAGAAWEGWPNRETWAVHLWCTAVDEATYAWWTEVGQEAPSVEAVERRLRGTLRGASFVRDLSTRAEWARVDWGALARSCWEDARG